VGTVAVALALINASINALRSRQSRSAIALRKTIAAGREFFISELRKDRPALRDEWYPWALAFGLGTQIDDWSAQRLVKEPEADHHWSVDTLGSAPSPERWGGFGGGRSGGAGGGASWAAAAGGMAAGVSAPSPSGGESDSGSYSTSGGSSDGGSSSGGGSSGGGGGGGW
jgi:hypothetical protein